MRGTLFLIDEKIIAESNLHLNDFLLKHAFAAYFRNTIGFLIYDHFVLLLYYTFSWIDTDL